MLNQYEFMARVTSPEEQENLAERADGTQDPPDEGDYTGDAEILSEAEGEELDQPRTRCATTSFSPSLTRYLQSKGLGQALSPCAAGDHISGAGAFKALGVSWVAETAIQFGQNLDDYLISISW